MSCKLYPAHAKGLHRNPSIGVVGGGVTHTLCTSLIANMDKDKVMGEVKHCITDASVMNMTGTGRGPSDTSSILPLHGNTEETKFI